MAGGVKRTSTFGNARKLPSGRWQASYWHEGKRYAGPHTFRAKADADAWLATVRTEVGRGQWIDPQVGKVTLAEYATDVMKERNAALA
jgi:hypothetical protein